MIAWRMTPAGVMIPTTWGRPVEKPAAPCPDHIREKLAAMRAEFAASPGMAARRRREENREKAKAAAEAQKAGRK